jgi:hypothetical protein
MAVVKINTDFSNINDVIYNIAYYESGESIIIEYGIRYVLSTGLTVPSVRVEYTNPMEAIRGVLGLMKVYNAGVESGKKEV